MVNILLKKYLFPTDRASGPPGLFTFYNDPGLTAVVGNLKMDAPVHRFLYVQLFFNCFLMNPELKALQKALKNRKAELEQLIIQMKTDQLNKGSVYKSLKEELSQVEVRLKDPKSRE